MSLSIHSAVIRNRQAARLSKDAVAISLLSTLLGSLSNKAIENKVETISDTESIEIINSFLKSNKLLQEKATGTILEQAKLEEELLRVYLPAYLAEDEIVKIATELKASGSNFGLIMKHFKENYFGQYDGQLLSTTVKAIF